MTSALAVDVRLPLADFALRVEFRSSARCLGVFGASGSGKTSLLEAIAGWRKGADGRIELGGRVLLDRAAGVDVALHRRHIGYVPQDALLFPHWSVERNVRAHSRRARAREQDAADEQREFERAVQVLGLAPLLGRGTHTLSGGERQRVALARALVSRPALLLLDEPLGGVDVLLRRRILPWLVRLRDAAPVGIVFVSHDPTEVQVLCDEVLVLERGAVQDRGAPAATLRRHFARLERFENVLEGRVEQLGAGTASVDVGGALIHVPRGPFAPGDRLAFALSSDDVLIARDAVAGLSARNVLAATIEGLEHGAQGSRVDLALEGSARGTLSATLTAEAVAQLGLAPGRRVYAIFKSSSCQVLTPQERE